MILSLRGFAQTVEDAAAAAQGAAAAALDFTVGSILRSLIEATASVVLWLQFVALQVLAATRLATSTGTDVDSFVADYGLTRLAATYATGSVTLSRYSTGSQALVTPGGQVKTLDGTQTFAITTNTANGAWSNALGGYVLAAGTASVSVPVQAVNLGTQGNVIAGAIGLLATAIPNIDTVTNPVAFTNALDAESDAALRARFALFIQSLARATPTAVGAAVLSVQQGLSYVLQEGVPGAGSFTLTVDDGSGNPPSSLLAAVYTAVNLVRPVGTSFAVFPPTVFGASVNVALTLPSTTVRAPVDAAVSLAISAYIGSLGVGQTLAFTYLASIVYGAYPGILNAAITINGVAADLVPTATQVIRVSSVTVA